MGVLTVGDSVQRLSAAPGASGEIAQLQAKVVKLRREINLLKERVYKLEHSPALVAGKPKTIAEEQAKAKAYPSVEAIFAEIPKSVMPDPKIGWDKISGAKASDWLQKNAVGKWLAVTTMFIKGDTDGMGRYYAVFELGHEEFLYQGMSVNCNRLGDCRLEVNEAAFKILKDKYARENAMVTAKVRAQIVAIERPFEVTKYKPEVNIAPGASGHFEIRVDNFLILEMKPAMIKEKLPQPGDKIP